MLSMNISKETLDRIVKLKSDKNAKYLFTTFNPELKQFIFTTDIHNL